jgi:DNA-binding NarL/FixJ family response regulator
LGEFQTEEIKLTTLENSIQPTPPVQVLGAPLLKVLFVEDDPDFANLVKLTLDAKGDAFQVHHEERLDDAFRALETQEFDVILVDLSLPDGSGTSTLGAACLLSRELPVVILTGSDDEKLAQAASNAGAQSYVSKSGLDRRALPEILRRAVTGHRRRIAASGG